MTCILSFIIAFGVAAIVGQVLIPLLRRLKAGQSIREDGPTWHMAKQGTPTMGGIMFIIAIAAAAVVAGWEELAAGNYKHLYVFLFALVFGVIGMIDDFQKLRHHANEGLTAAQKFLLQLAADLLGEILLPGFFEPIDPGDDHDLHALFGGLLKEAGSIAAAAGDHNGLNPRLFGGGNGQLCRFGGVFFAGFFKIHGERSFSG